MHKRRPIRDKLLLGGLLVGIMVATLSASSFLGIYSYRRLVRALSCRAAELPRASALGAAVSDLRLVHARALSGDPGTFDGPGATAPLGLLRATLTPRDEAAFGDWFTDQIERTWWALERYCDELAARDVAVDRDAMWQAYRIGACSGIAMAVTASMIVGRTARGDEMFCVMTERHAAQLLDLDTAALVD